MIDVNDNIINNLISIYEEMKLIIVYTKKERYMLDYCIQQLGCLINNIQFSKLNNFLNKEKRKVYSNE